MPRRSHCALTPLALCALANPSLAQTSTPADAIPSETAPPRAILSFTPYAWLTSYDGRVGSHDIEVDVDASFADILDESDSILGLMGALDLEVGRFVFQASGALAKAEFSGTRGRARDGLVVDSSVGVAARAVLENAWFEGFAGYRFVDAPIGESGDRRVRLDAFGGVRYTDLEVAMDVTADANVTLPRGEVLQGGVEREFANHAAWVEPFVGVRASLDLSKNWRASLRGDAGGFGVDGSSFAWQAIGALGYNWSFDSWSLGLFAGYRAIGQDYEGSGMIWDTITHGPVLGLCAAFTF
ncbi:MAG: hypothetical protein IT434_09515 [Phycisphaerales bacterium]|jgi:hypothetical protein|nr:hypothetical protein [Phycisphaerales bacterium]